MSLDRVVNNLLGISDEDNCCGEIAILSAAGYYSYKPCRKRPTEQLDNGHWWCGSCMVSPRIKPVNPTREK